MRRARGGPSSSGRRWRLWWHLAAAALAILCCAGCGDDDPESPPPPTAEPFFPVGFQNTYTHVVECAFSPAHDSSFVEVYVSPGAETAYVNGAAEMPAGSVCVIILRSEDCAGDVIRYEAMRKGAPGSDSTSGDWEWQAVRPDLSVLESGQIERCATCHATCVQAQDYICGDPLFPPDFLDSYILVRDCRFSSDHNLSRVRVYVDSTGAQSYLNGNYPLPVGTVSVKVLTPGDNEECEGAEQEWVVMVKGPAGTAPSTNDWIWQSVNPNRSVRLSGQLEGECIACHEDCTKGRDYMCTDP